MGPLHDTIVAPITAYGRGAVAIVRVSGPDAFGVARGLCPDLPEQPESGRARYVRLSNGDDGLLLAFADGAGYTGEPSVEFQVHGSTASVQTLVDACLRRGCRLAEPGEFTFRSFLNGRMDLTQAEAVRSLAEAQTALQLREAGLRRDGALRRRIAGLRQSVLELLAEVEARIDFSEEIGELDAEQAAERIFAIRQEIAGLLSTAASGRILRSGFRVALVGEPNVGKSSLLNALAGRDRAIVTDVPGTTRDFIEEPVDLDGLPVVLIDTAGLRHTDDPVEREGVRRTHEVAAAADLVLLLHPCVSPVPPPSLEVEPPLLMVRTKCDLGPPRGEGLPISTVTGEGMADLRGEIVRLSGVPDSLGPSIEPRHAPLLEAADAALDLAARALADGLTTDLLATALQSALRELGRIDGSEVDADLLDAIFSTFCIGK
ncbi:MAG: tRNA uridine-5-carboxymethylaminomethyl(34) synthesis GTPase MnmE [Fimbriimonadales bacterium]